MTTRWSLGIWVSLTTPGQVATESFKLTYNYDMKQRYIIKHAYIPE